MRSDYRIWHIIEGLRESLGDALSGLSLNTQEITNTKNRVRNLETTPIGGVTSYNDLTDKPTIPTALSSLSEDSTHRVVTDTEKSTWNGKADSTHIHSGTLIFTYFT